MKMTKKEYLKLPSKSSLGPSNNYPFHTSRKVNTATGKFVKLPSQSHLSTEKRNFILGRVVVFATAKSYHKTLLKQYLETFSTPCYFQDALYVQLPTIIASEFIPEVFYFDYGVMVCWGTTEDDEKLVSVFIVNEIMVISKRDLFYFFPFFNIQVNIYIALQLGYENGRTLRSRQS
jgi:uncharacterized Rmd1/YagE family protein